MRALERTGRSEDMITVRRVEAGEWGLYRRLRLAALADSPDSFATTLASAKERSPESWAEQVRGFAAGSDRIGVLAFQGEEPVGLAACYRDRESPESGEAVQLWVEPARRGSPAAAHLIAAIESWAREHGFRSLTAWVNTDNRRALRFLERRGYERTGVTQPFRPGSEQVACRLVRRFQARNRSSRDGGDHG